MKVWLLYIMNDMNLLWPLNRYEIALTIERCWLIYIYMIRCGINMTIRNVIDIQVEWYDIAMMIESVDDTWMTMNVLGTIWKYMIHENDSWTRMNRSKQKTEKWNRDSWKLYCMLNVHCIRLKGAVNCYLASEETGRWYWPMGLYHWSTWKAIYGLYIYDRPKEPWLTGIPGHI